jgi:hypothetical protein
MRRDWLRYALAAAVPAQDLAIASRGWLCLTIAPTR